MCGRCPFEPFDAICTTVAVQPVGVPEVTSGAEIDTAPCALLPWLMVAPPPTSFGWSTGHVAVKGAETARPEMTATAVGDWCRLGGSGRSFIEPGSPWHNPFVESFGSRVRDEVLSVEAFDSVLEAQTVIEDWRTIYNHKRPHGSLGWKTPAAYAASLNRQPDKNTPRLS